MLNPAVPNAPDGPGTAKVVSLPSGIRTKPTSGVIPSAASPVTTPSELMLDGSVPMPGELGLTTSNVAKVPSGALRKP